MTQAFPAFVTDTPDSAPPAPAATPTPTLGDIIGAHWTLGRQDQAGQPLQAQIDAYGTVTKALDTALPDDRPTFQQWTSDRYFTNPYAGMPVDTDKVWQDVTRARAANPDFLKDIPATDDASFQRWVQQGELARRRAAQAVTARQSGVVQGAAGLAADIGTGFTDPINLAAMVLTGPLGGAAKTLPQIMAREALVNGAITTAQLPSMSGNRAAFGEEMTPTDMLETVGMGAAGGAVFGAGTHASPVVGKAVAGAVSDAIDKVAPGYRAARALNAETLAPANDAEILATYEGRVPPDQRTPDEQAAVHVVRRQAEGDAARPFVPTPAGAAAHADALNQAIAAVDRALQADTPTSPAPRVSQTTAPLDHDGIVHFVLNDLEDGPAVVHYSQADGGTTKYGIAQADNPGVDVANLTEDQAAKIARQKYWFPELDHVDPKLAAVAFDAGYISGPKFGRQLLEAAGGDADRALDLYRQHLDHIADTVPGKAKYRRGWNNRVDKLARRLDGVADGLPVLEPGQFEDADSWRTAQDALDQETLASEGRATAIAERTDAHPNTSPTILRRDDIAAAASSPDGLDMAKAGEWLRQQSDEALAAGRQVSIVIEGKSIPIVGNGLVDAQGQSWGAMPFLMPRPEDDVRLEIGGRADAPQPAAAMAGRRPPSISTEVDTAGEPVVAVKAKTKRAPRRIANPTLLDFVAQHGGIRNDEGHDLYNTGIKKITNGGRVITRAGLPLDRMRELAAEAGYFHNYDPQEAISNTTTADFLELLERASRERIVAVSDLGDELDRRAAEEDEIYRGSAIRAVDRAIDEAGYDLDLTDDEKMAIYHDAGDRGVDGRSSRADLEDALFEHLRNAQADDASEAARLVNDGDYAIPAFDDDGLQIRDARNEEADGFGGESGERREAADGTARVDGAASQEPAGAAGGAEEGVRLDDLQAAGETGPLPDNPETITREAERFDDPAGPVARAQSDSVEHDLAMDRGAETDPAIAARDRQRAELGAKSPMRAKAEQDGTMGLGLFDAADQPGFRLDAEGPEHSFPDAMKAADDDLDAVERARACMAPPKGTKA